MQQLALILPTKKAPAENADTYSVKISKGFS